MLTVRELDCFYSDLQVLRGVSLDVGEGEVVALFGPNGHGKSTLLKAICGLQPPKRGSIRFKGEEIAGLPAHQIVERGLAYIPEERHLFSDMTVLENLYLGAYPRHARPVLKKNLEFVFHIFPRLAERRHQLCSTLSGGEARMVAIGRGLMSETSLLMVDEPSIGLSPGMKMAVFDAIRQIHCERGMTILIVEQEIQHALEMSDRIYLIKKGQIAFERRREEVQVDEIERAYF
ncbi:MAG: ABC transporter ATP-binding protein [Anaerolineales bacterium]|nr:ABC transporter ATP-binding protein [Anaerolineales bacterium]MCS7247454.1 ABC transporter ATP-binding protein [Anaerolineales bacterium]MDW8161265.1 ABC transporter ATP-binding protein [Anaerolineales bacterium]MDW8447096.1 ABC transporter ATP-binding protein [Anaerolineales bacterium]